MEKEGKVCEAQNYSFIICYSAHVILNQETV